jgi:hypothetical protein
MREGQKNIRPLQYISTSSATAMSPYRNSADVAGSSQNGQLHGLNTPTLFPPTDTYISPGQTVREWSEIILKDVTSERNRAYTGYLPVTSRSDAWRR